MGTGGCLWFQGVLKVEARFCTSHAGGVCKHVLHDRHAGAVHIMVVVTSCRLVLV